MATKKTAKKDMVLAEGTLVRDRETFATVFLPAGTVVGDYSYLVHESRLVEPGEFGQVQEVVAEPAPKPKRTVKKEEPKAEYDFGTE